jgi:hypothetical protein
MDTYAYSHFLAKAFMPGTVPVRHCTSRLLVHILPVHYYLLLLVRSSVIHSKLPGTTLNEPEPDLSFARSTPFVTFAEIRQAGARCSIRLGQY